MGAILDIIRSLIQKEAARLVAGASALAVAGALKLADLLGVTLTGDVVAGVAAIAALIATEVIRRLVFSRDSVEQILSEK